MRKNSKRMPGEKENCFRKLLNIWNKCYAARIKQEVSRSSCLKKVSDSKYQRCWHVFPRDSHPKRPLYKVHQSKKTFVQGDTGPGCKFEKLTAVHIILLIL